MKRHILLFAGLIMAAGLLAQKPVNKTFWKEDFTAGKIPAGWQTIVLNDSATKWFVTDQPFPGSPGRTHQAPPIASVSRGYHLQVAPGVKVDKNSRAWKKISIWPDSYVQTAAIDCSKHRSVVLKFQQNFFWNRRDSDKGAGLFVGVSTNGKDWTELKSAAIWQKRHEHSEVVFQDKLCLYGGYADVLSSEVWTGEVQETSALDSGPQPRTPWPRSQRAPVSVQSPWRWAACTADRSSSGSLRSSSANAAFHAPRLAPLRAACSTA